MFVCTTLTHRHKDRMLKCSQSKDFHRIKCLMNTWLVHGNMHLLVPRMESSLFAGGTNARSTLSGGCVRTQHTLACLTHNTVTRAGRGDGHSALGDDMLISYQAQQSLAVRINTNDTRLRAYLQYFCY